MSEIYFIRHGQASFRERDYDRLSPIGIRQSQALAKHLIKYHKQFDAVYSGDMKRHKHTKKYFTEMLMEQGKTTDGTKPMAAFNEYDSSSLFAARSRQTGDVLDHLKADKKAFQNYFAETVHHWMDGMYDHEINVESWTMFRKRVSDAISYLMALHGRSSRLLIFTSGGPISIVLQMALGITDFMTVELSWQIMNASITVFKYNERGIVLSKFNKTSHLLMEQDPELLTYR